MDVTTHPHVSVENVERTTADALVLGATLVDTTDVPGLARLATLRDTEGALFGLWQPAPHQGAVDDCNAGIERGKRIGGSPVFVRTVPKHGRIGSLRDPGGAMFVIRGPVHSQT